MSAKRAHLISSDRQLAALVINSREKAEDFIEKYMKRHKVGRSVAVMRLRQLGIRMSKLP